MKKCIVKKVGCLFLSIICIMTFVVLFFCVYVGNFLTHTSDEFESTGQLDEIVSGSEYTQKLMATRDYLQEIQIYITTYNRVNDSTLFIELRDENKLVENWEIETKLLKDNTYYTLRLKDKIKFSRDHEYVLKIYSDAILGEGVSIYTSDLGDKNGLLLNNEEMKKNLCYKMIYKGNLREVWNDVSDSHIVMLFLLLIIVIILFFFCNNIISIEKLFLCMWVPVSIMYFISLTPIRTPDESHHLYRAYEVSQFNLLSKYDNENYVGGRELPFDLSLRMISNTWNDFENNKDLELSDNVVFKSYSNTALYSPISYLPQSIGIFLSRNLTNNLVIIIYAGRIMNWIMITLCLYIAIKIIPSGKEALVFIALIPMNVHEAVTLAPDGMVVAVSAVLVAYVLYLRWGIDKRCTKLQLFYLYLLAFVVGQYKIVYLPFCLLYFLIPNERFGCKQEKVKHAIGVMIVSVIPSLVWLKLCNQFLIVKGTNATWQIAFVLEHPINYVITAFRTYFSDGYTWFMQLFGNSLGALDINISGTIIIIYAIMLILKYKPDYEDTYRKQTIQKIMFIFTVLAIVILITTSLYVQWTAAYSSKIIGIQGRYFLPLLLPLYFTANSAHSESEKNKIGVTSAYIAVSINMCACIKCLLEVLVY